MKLQVLQENLAKAILVASKFASSRAQLPVLGNILLTTEKNKLSVSATNLEMSINISLGAKIEDDGEITVPAKLFNEIIQNLNKGTVELSSDKEKIIIKSERFNSTLAGMNSSDFPAVPSKVGDKTIQLPFEDFAKGLGKVLFAVSVDETRPVLTGMLMLMQKDKTEFVATDGYRLSRKMFSAKTGNALKEDLIIPRQSLTELMGLGEEEILQMQNDKKNNQLIFKSGSFVLSTRVISGQFPDYQKIIPKNHKIKVDLDKEDLVKAIRLASVFARDAANVIKILVNKEGLEISAESQYSGNQKSKVEAKVEGEELEIAFNYKYLLDYLQTVEGDSIVLKLNDANSPGVFEDPQDKDYLHLIMPVRLSA